MFVSDFYAKNKIQESISPIDLAELLYNSLDKKYPEAVRRYGHEVVGDMIMDYAEDAQSIRSMSDVDIAVDEIMDDLANFRGDKTNELPADNEPTKLPANINDDDWYVIDDQGGIVSSHSPSAYRPPFGTRIIELENGQRAMRGLTMKIEAPKGLARKDTQSNTEPPLKENLRKWFKEKWVRFGPDGKIRGACARGDDSEGKPKCLPQSKAHSLGKKGRASAAARKRREDPNPERSGKAINVATKKKSNEGVAKGLNAEAYKEKLLATLPQIMRFYAKNVKGWRPSQEQMLAAVETGYTVMKHTGDVQQAGRAVMDELNTLHRMSQGQQGVAEGKIKLSTDPNWYGAEVGNCPVFNVHPHLLVGFEPDDKMNQPKSKANVDKIIAGLKQGAKLPPLLVRKYKDGYQVLDGHHRFWAYKLLGVKSVPVQVVPAEDVEEISRQGVAEGSQQTQFTDEELDAINQYLDDDLSFQGLRTYPGLIRKIAAHLDITSIRGHSGEMNFYDRLVQARAEGDIPQQGVAEAFGPLPRDNQTIRLGKHTVEIERVGKHNNYIGFAWHDSQGREHYEEVPVGDLGSYDDLIDTIKGEIRYQERRLKQGMAGNSLEEGVNDPHIFKCIFLFGPMGAGKSTVAGPLLSHTGLRSVNLDNFNEMFIKKGQVPTGHLSPDQLEKSWQLSQIQQQNFIDGRLGIIIDGSGRNPETALSVIKKLKPLGYEFMMIFVNVSEATSIARQQSRANKQQQQWGVGRQVDITTAKDTYAQVQQNLAQYKEYFGPQRFIYVDNENTPDLTQATKQIDAFLRAPVSRPEALAWIQAQKGGQQVAQQQQKVARSTDRQQQALARYQQSLSTAEFAKQGVVEAVDTKSLDSATVRRIQNYLNKEFDANLDVDGELGPLTLKSIKKYIPASRKKPAPDSQRTTAVQGNEFKEQQLDEKCWPGYKKKGMKTMFGKRYPNCVKKEDIEKQQCPECGGPMFSSLLINEKKDACYYKVKSRYKVWPSAYASGALVQCRKKGAGNWGSKTNETRFYFIVKATLAESLRDDFAMTQDSDGWYISEDQGPAKILEAQRAFGVPKIKEVKLKEVRISDYTGRADTIGDDNTASPIGSIAKRGKKHA